MIGGVGKAPAGVTGALPDCSRKALPYGASRFNLGCRSLRWNFSRRRKSRSLRDIQVLQGGTGYQMMRRSFATLVNASWLALGGLAFLLKRFQMPRGCRLFIKSASVTTL